MSIRAFCCTNIYRFHFFFLYDAVPPCDTQLPSETLFVTTIYTYILMEVVYHRGGTVSYKYKLKSLYILKKKCPDRHENLDY